MQHRDKEKKVRPWLKKCFTVASLIVLIVTGCSSKIKTQIIGTWQDPYGGLLIFYQDGTVEVSGGLVPATGNYSFTDSEHIRVEFSGLLALGGSQVFEVTINNDTLTLTDQYGDSTMFARLNTSGGTGTSSQLNNEPPQTLLPTFGQVGDDLDPPQTDEQAAAAAVIKQWSYESEFRYRNAQYSTDSQDGDFAEVRVVMEVEHLNYDPSLWSEIDALVPVRLIGGSWTGDTQNIVWEYTDAGWDVLATADMATAEAEKIALEATADSLSAMLGGTLIFAGEEQASVHVVMPDGTEHEITPLGRGEDIAYEHLELAPESTGFYFASDTDWVTPAIFYSDINGESVRELWQFGGQRFLQGISISPDEELLAVVVNSFAYAPNQLWIVPTSGNEEPTLVWESDTEDLSAPVWTSDSQAVYAVRKWGENGPSIVRIERSGEVEEVNKLPSQPVSEDADHISRLLTLSPDEDDLLVGASSLSVYNFERNTYTTLDQFDVVCNPVWTDDQRVVFASGNQVIIYYLTDGSLVYPYYIPVSDINYDGCPHSFDWLP